MIQIAPLHLTVVLVTASLMLSAAVLSMALSKAQHDFQMENMTLKQKVRMAGAARLTAKPPLPQFHEFDSSRLFHALNHLADQAQVPLTEINYVLDDGNNRPYLRYRAALKVTSSYLSIRTFIDSVRGGLQDVTLDSISCTRENVKATKLNCELGFSAFYRKGSGG